MYLVMKNRYPLTRLPTSSSSVTLIVLHQCASHRQEHYSVFTGHRTRELTGCGRSPSAPMWSQSGRSVVTEKQASLVRNRYNVPDRAPDKDWKVAPDRAPSNCCGIRVASDFRPTWSLTTLLSAVGKPFGKQVAGSSDLVSILILKISIFGFVALML